MEHILQALLLAALLLLCFVVIIGSALGAACLFEKLSRRNRQTLTDLNDNGTSPRVEDARKWLKGKL